MQIIDYKSFHGSERRDGYIAIPELNRFKPSAGQFIKMAELDIVLTRPTAFIYIDGFLMSSSENPTKPDPAAKYLPVIKSGSCHIAHEWVRTFKNNKYVHSVEIMTGVCAAGVQAIQQAQQALDGGFVKDVIIIGGERITDGTLRLFKELRIPVVCGDGFVYIRLSNDLDGGIAEIIHPTWRFHYNNNPFVFPTEVLDEVIPYYPVDFVKLHGTGTGSNDDGEKNLAVIAKPLKYKEHIGHTQGVSALVETCIVLADDNILGKILVTANGLGGYYGAFTLIK